MFFSRVRGVKNIRQYSLIKEQPRIVLIGVPVRFSELISYNFKGAGKGTQSQKLERDYGIHSISTGNLLRNEIAKKSPIADTIATQMQGGGLVSDEIVLELAKQTLTENKVRTLTKIDF
jgi:hypothetical protein